MQMSENTVVPKKSYDEDKYFNSQLFIYINFKDKDNPTESTERLSYDPNGTPQPRFKECLTKDLLEQIDQEPLISFGQCDDDWTTDNSNKGDQCLNSYNNYNRNNYPLKQKKTKSKKPKKKGLVERTGDWSCFFCKNLNFAYRHICNRCFVSKIKSDKSHDDCLNNVLNAINNNEEIRKSMFNNE